MSPKGKLVSKKTEREIFFCLDGLVDAEGRIKQQVRSLKSSLDHDLIQTAQLLTELDFQIFVQLVLGLRYLDKPFRRLRKRVYKRLVDTENPNRSATRE